MDAFNKNNNSDDTVSAENNAEVVASAKRGRGRPRGSGRKHPEGTRPKSLANFTELAELLIVKIRLSGPETNRMTDADIIEEALVRQARAMGNQLWGIEATLRRYGR